MAKINNSVKFTKGLLNVDTMEIVEETKEGSFTYDLLLILNRFNEKYVNISITEENPVTPKDMQATPNVADDPEEE